MARVRMVTRTVVGTNVNVMCVNTLTAQIEYKDFMLGTYTDDTEQTLKAVKKLYETDELKIVKLETCDKVEKCFGMLETEFLNYAHELDLKTRKMLEENTEIDVLEDDNPFEENVVEVEQKPQPKKTPKKRK